MRRSKDWYILGINDDTDMPLAQLVCAGQTREDEFIIMQTDNSFIIISGALTTVKGNPLRIDRDMPFYEARELVKQSLQDILERFAYLTESTTASFGITGDIEKPVTSDFINLCTYYALS